MVTLHINKPDEWIDESAGHLPEVGTPKASAGPTAAVGDSVYLPPTIPIDPTVQAALNLGDPKAAAGLIQDMRAAYQAQREAWKAMENYYKSKTSM